MCPCERVPTEDNFAPFRRTGPSLRSVGTMQRASSKKRDMPNARRSAVVGALIVTLAGCSESGTADGSGGAFASGGQLGAAGGAPSTSGGGGSPGGGTGGGSASGGSAPSGGASTGGASGGSTGGVSSGGSAAGTGGGSSLEATIVPDPSWTCGLPEGIAAPDEGALVFEATLEVGEVYDVGTTQYGERRVLDIQGGTVTSPMLSANFLEGGFDFELTLSSGATELEQVNLLRASDDSLIYLRTCGVAPAGESTVRIVPDFEVANSSPLAWLNTGTFVGTRRFDADTKALVIAIYEAASDSTAATIELLDPPADVNQPWECNTLTGSKGDSVFTETVTLGGSISTGASKRGTRNVIPITGGTVTGELNGEVLPGGADYQLAGNSTVLDARYMLKADDGEYVVVRNCGAFGALIPWFETRAAGPYAFLNDGEFLSSDPGSASGGVSITFYERQ